MVTTRLVVAMMWLLHFLPLRALNAIGRMVGTLLYVFARERRDIALTNLQLCFPQLDGNARAALTRRHFQALGRSILERGLLWWASRERIERLVRARRRRALAGRCRTTGDFARAAFRGHGNGWNARATRTCRGLRSTAGRRTRCSTPSCYAGRTRFARAPIYSRQDGVRPIIRALRDGLSLYYLPDMDLGHRDAIVRPVLRRRGCDRDRAQSRLLRSPERQSCRASRASLREPQATKLRLYPTWEHFPSGDLAADVRRMNAFIEERVREMPEQYFWVHKRFKTRPQGEANPYEQHAPAG